eukprot:scaffold129_cov254-Pinguiococcus_pyrenoidosus.AAC.19
MAPTSTRWRPMAGRWGTPEVTFEDLISGAELSNPSNSIGVPHWLRQWIGQHTAGFECQSRHFAHHAFNLLARRFPPAGGSEREKQETSEAAMMHGCLAFALLLCIFASLHENLPACRWWAGCGCTAGRK